MISLLFEHALAITGGTLVDGMRASLKVSLILRPEEVLLALEGTLDLDLRAILHQMTDELFVRELFVSALFGTGQGELVQSVLKHSVDDFGFESIDTGRAVLFFVAFVVQPLVDASGAEAHLAGRALNRVDH